MSDRTRGILAIVASAFGFALMAFFVRLCDDFGGAVPSIQKSFFRNLLAFAIAAVAFARLPSAGRAVSHLAPKAWVALVLRSAFGTLGIFANFYALSHITIAEGQTLNKTAPFFTVVFAWWFLREKVARRQLAALALAFLGVLLIAKPGFAGASALPLASGLLGGLCAGAAYATVRYLGRARLEPAFIVLFFSAFSCLASVPFMLCGFAPMTAAQVVILFGAGAGAALGQFGITCAYRFAAPREIAVFDYSNILFTAALGFAFFGQIPDALALAGFAVIIAAAWMLKRA